MIEIGRGADGSPAAILAPVANVPPDILKAMAEDARGKYRYFEDRPIENRHLAVCGAGPSLAGALGELMDWKGDVWGINGAAKYLRDNGVPCTFFSVDALPYPDDYYETPGPALCATSVDSASLSRFKDLRVFDIVETHPDGIPGGSSTAGRAPALALRMGFMSVTFFGCCGSFTGDKAKLYVDADEMGNQIIVKVGSKEYRTMAQYLFQCKELAEVIRLFPNVFMEKSGGLLRAMVEDENYEVLALSTSLVNLIQDSCGVEFGNAYAGAIP